MLISSLSLSLYLPHLLVNRPVRFRQPLHGCLEFFALPIEPFLLLEQGGFFLFQRREVGRCGQIVSLSVLQYAGVCRLVQQDFPLMLGVELFLLGDSRKVCWYSQSYKPDLQTDKTS